MYQEKKYHIDWFGVVLKVILALLLLLLTVKLLSMIIANNKNKVTEEYMNNNIKVMDEVSVKYFSDKLPKNDGESVKVSLNDLIKDGFISELKNDKNENCNFEESYIKVTKLNKEYQYKSYLVCGNETNYNNTFVEIEENKKEEKETTTTKVETKKKKTTKKTTTSKKYSVSFNTNGGDYIETIKVKENATIGNIVPVRNGYKFVGWYYHGELFDINTKINKDYVLVAKWIK